MSVSKNRRRKGKKKASPARRKLPAPGRLAMEGVMDHGDLRCTGDRQGETSTEHMVRPEAEPVSVDKLHVALQRKSPGAVGEAAGIGDRDELRVAHVVATVLANRRFADRAVMFGRVFRLDHGSGRGPAVIGSSVRSLEA